MKNHFNEPWISHRRSMLESPAWRCLPLAAQRVLSAIEVEHLRQGGKKNGDLVAPYSALMDYCGMSRRIIARSLRELEALGFLDVKRAEVRRGTAFQPNRYRLTYLGSPSDEWREVKSFDDARKRLAATPRRRRRNTWLPSQRRGSAVH